MKFTDSMPWFKLSFPFINSKRFFYWWNYPTNVTTFMANMELSNGNMSHFIVRSSWSDFKWMKRRYIIDFSNSYYDVSFGMRCIDYHEECSIPIRKKVDIDLLKKALIAEKTFEAKMAINPKNLDYSQDSNVISDIYTGSAISKKLEMMFTMMIVALVVIIGTFLIVLHFSGILGDLGVKL